MSNCYEISQNLNNYCELLLNKQIRKEFRIAQIYYSFYIYFMKTDSCYANISKYFYNSYLEERLHGDIIVKYMIKRGAKIELTDIPLDLDINKLMENEDNLDKSSLLLAFETVLDKEKKINKSILKIVNSANNFGDNHLVDFLGFFLKEQVDSIYKVSIICNQLKKIGNNGFNLWQYDHNFDFNIKCQFEKMFSPE